MSASAELPSARPAALENVPTFPAVAGRLMRLVSDENSDLSYKEVANLIRTDSGFSVEVLRLANSPVFGFRYEIKDIPHAVAVLGINRLRAIVTTLAMKEFMLTARKHEAVQQSWRHNLATALACEALAGAFWVDRGLGYTAGLLHDVGLLAMISTHLESYSDLVFTPVRDPDDFLRRERAMLGIDHCEAGLWLLTDWALPLEFRQVAENHHRKPDGRTPEIAALVYLGCLTASMAGFPTCNFPSTWDLELIVSHLPEKARTRYRAKLEDLPMDIATKINSFDCDFLT